MRTRFIVFPVTVLAIACLINLDFRGTNEAAIAPEVIAVGASYTQDVVATQAPVQLAMRQFLFQ